MSDTDDTPEYSLWTYHYCVPCKTLVLRPGDHRSEVHDGDFDLDMLPLEDRERGDVIAQPPEMGHFTPHQWFDDNGHQRCGHCDAVKVPPEAIAEAGFDPEVAGL